MPKSSAFMPTRRLFSENFFNRVPEVTRYLIYGNMLFYSFRFVLDRNAYVKELYYHRMAIANGRFHTLLTCHFAKSGFFEFIVDTLILGLVAGQQEMMLGQAALKKMVLCGMGFGSLGLLLFHRDDYFTKSDAIFKTIIFYFIFSFPGGKIMLFPFPFQIKPIYIAGFSIAIDMLGLKWANLGGSLAGFLLAKRII